MSARPFPRFEADHELIDVEGQSSPHERNAVSGITPSTGGANIAMPYLPVVVSKYFTHNGETDLGLASQVCRIPRNACSLVRYILSVKACFKR